MLNHRQKCVLYLLQQLKKCKKIQLAKLLFLLEKETNISRLCAFYSFLPYKYGPYSFELFHDIDRFENEKYISKTNTSLIYNNKHIDIYPSLKHTIKKIISTYSPMEYRDLINYVYQNYPDYTIFSEINKTKPYIKNQTGIFTVGYQGKSIDKFLNILIQEKTHSLVDIRYNPWSMKYGYSKHILQSLCERLKITYYHIPELGIPGNMRDKLDSKKDYEQLFIQYSNHLKSKLPLLKNLKEQSKAQKIALMCFEEDPNYCHRHILGEHLKQMNTRVTIT